MLTKGEVISYVFSVDADDTPTKKRTLAVDCTVVERKQNPVDDKVWAVLEFKSGRTVKRPEEEIVTLNDFDDWEDAEKGKGIYSPVSLYTHNQAGIL